MDRGRGVPGPNTGQSSDGTGYGRVVPSINTLLVDGSLGDASPRTLNMLSSFFAFDGQL